MLSLLVILCIEASSVFFFLFFFYGLEGIFKLWWLNEVCPPNFLQCT